MNEGSLYDRELAALAIKQARGDLIEAIFLLRAFRATLPRFGASEPVDTSDMAVKRRSRPRSKTCRAEILGPTFDYTHRLLEPQSATRGIRAGVVRGRQHGDAARYGSSCGDDMIERSPQAADDEPLAI